MDLSSPQAPLVAITTASFAEESAQYYRRLFAAGLRVVRNVTGCRLKENEVTELVRDAVGIIAGTEPLTNSVLQAAPALRVISRCGVGLDNVDLEAATRLGIAVRITPQPVIEAAAELTIGLMLDACRRITEADRSLRAGQWRQLMGASLKHKTIGIIGCGRVGREVVKLLAGFEPHVLVNDPVELPSDFAHTYHVEQVSLDQLLGLSDIVTLHVAYTPGIHHLIGASELAKMKSSAILINTARGGLVDEQALCDALTDGRLSAAAIDTYEQEPYAGPLIRVARTILSCHMGSYAHENRMRAEEEAVDNLLFELRSRGIVP